MTPPVSTRTYSFRFGELGIPRKQVEVLLGGCDGPDGGPFSQYIDDVFEVAGTLRNIGGIFAFFDNIGFSVEKRTTTVNGIVFQTGKMVTAQLRKAVSVALFVCTAGPELEKYSREQMKSGNMPEGYIADLLGSIIVEAAIDKMHTELTREMVAAKSGATNRYSPGYCNWNVAEQQKLFRLIPPELTSVRLSESSLMHPVKSVSGIIGIGRGLKNKPYSCNVCDAGDCIYRDKKYYLADSD